MPTPGPVAYHVQSFSLTSLVISTGFDHVAPSSVLLLTQAVREPSLLPSMIFASVSLPRLWVNSSQMVPVLASTIGQGLPHVFGPSSQTTCCGCHVLPPSMLRFNTR